MKKSIIIFLIIFSSCSSNKINNSKKVYEIVTPKIVKTHDQSLPYPYIHINGFKDYEINSSDIITDKSGSYSNELRFNATYSALYTKKVMYEKYGLWDKEFRVNNEKHPILIWENVELFNDNKLYTIYASGFEDIHATGKQVERNSLNKQMKGSNHSIYSSVFVLDSDKVDCLNGNNKELKKEIIRYFSNGIKTLTSNNEFYELYWETVKKKRIKTTPNNSYK